MPRPRFDYALWISRIPDHADDLPAESESPIEHYTRGANDAWNLLGYFERNVKKAKVYTKPFQQHLLRLRSMVLFSLVESFERFLKEAASVCVDRLATRVVDDRLSGLTTHSQSVAAHFQEKTLGKALCESSTWLDSDAINARFGKLLAEPYKTQSPSFTIFPRPQDKKDPEHWRRNTMDILWQLRHSIAHNVGIITRSDAVKLRLLRQAPVDAPKVLQLTNGDIWYVKLFLDDMSQWINSRVASRLADVLTLLHLSDSTLFVPDEEAAALAKVFRVPVTINGVKAAP